MYQIYCSEPFLLDGTCLGTLTSSLAIAPFDVSQIDPVVAVSAFSSGLIVMGVPYLVVLLSRNILSAIKNR